MKRKRRSPKKLSFNPTKEYIVKATTEYLESGNTITKISPEEAQEIIHNAPVDLKLKESEHVGWVGPSLQNNTFDPGKPGWMH